MKNNSNKQREMEEAVKAKKTEEKDSFFERYIRKLTRNVFLDFDKNPPKVDEWKAFIDKLPISEDPFVQSENKYKCRNFYFDLKYKLITNTYAFFKLIGIYIKKIYLLSFNKVGHEYILGNKVKYDMVIQQREDLDIDDVFPLELYSEFPKYIIVPATHERILILNKDFNYAYKKLAKRNRFNFNYRLLALKEFALHSYLIENYDPKALIVYINERNTLSPIIKEVYEKQGREFIGFMHGTDLWHLIKSYMAFSRYYIWDKEYIPMYENDMKCIIGKYIVHTPGKNSRKYSEKEEYAKDLTYYMSGQKKDAIKILSNIVKELKNINKSLLIRPHPRIKFDFSEFTDEDIESFNIDITSSIDESEYIVGASTTVVEQGYYGGKKVLIDDVTDVKLFEELSKRKYLMLNKLGEENVELFSKYLLDLGLDLNKIQKIN